MSRDLAKVLVATLRADAKAIEALRAKGVKAGDRFDMEIGGSVDPSAGEPVRVVGTVIGVSEGISRGAGQIWVNVKLGREMYW